MLGRLVGSARLSGLRQPAVWRNRGVYAAGFNPRCTNFSTRHAAAQCRHASDFATVSRSLSPRPERQTRTISSRRSFGASFST